MSLMNPHMKRSSNIISGDQQRPTELVRHDQPSAQENACQEILGRVQCGDTLSYWNTTYGWWSSNWITDTNVSMFKQIIAATVPEKKGPKISKHDRAPRHQLQYLRTCLWQTRNDGVYHLALKFDQSALCRYGDEGSYEQPSKRSFVSSCKEIIYLFCRFPYIDFWIRTFSYEVLIVHCFQSENFRPQSPPTIILNHSIFKNTMTTDTQPRKTMAADITQRQWQFLSWETMAIFYLKKQW